MVSDCVVGTIFDVGVGGVTNVCPPLLVCVCLGCSPVFGVDTTGLSVAIVGKSTGRKLGCCAIAAADNSGIGGGCVGGT